MRNLVHHHARARTAHDHGTGGFILWIAAYAAFMLILIAFDRGGQFLPHPMLTWPSFPGIG